MGNMVTNVCAKFNYDRFHSDKALVNFWKSQAQDQVKEQKEQRS